MARIGGDLLSKILAEIVLHDLAADLGDSGAAQYCQDRILIFRLNLFASGEVELVLAEADFDEARNLDPHEAAQGQS